MHNKGDIIVEYNELVWSIIDQILLESASPERLEAARKVYARKADQLERNTIQNKNASNIINYLNTEQGKSAYHNKYPDATTQDRYNYLNKVNTYKNKNAQKSSQLNQGAQRLYSWGQKQGSIPVGVANAAIKMKDKGIENQQSHRED